MKSEPVYHNFKIGDYVYLVFAEMVLKVDSAYRLYQVNTTHPAGIRHATSEEIEKLTGGNQ